MAPTFPCYTCPRRGEPRVDSGALLPCRRTRPAEPNAILSVYFGLLVSPSRAFRLCSSRGFCMLHARVQMFTKHMKHRCSLHTSQQAVGLLLSRSAEEGRDDCLQLRRGTRRGCQLRSAVTNHRERSTNGQSQDLCKRGDISGKTGLRRAGPRQLTYLSQNSGA